MALVAIESQFNSRARSPAGALGLTQVMPDTARGEGLQDPKVNLYQPELGLATGATPAKDVVRVSRLGAGTRRIQRRPWRRA